MHAGIPDFRSKGGIYDQLRKEGKTENPEDTMSYDIFKRDPSLFTDRVKMLFPGNYRPTKAHFLVKLLQEKGLLVRHFTQNIDGLDHLAGIDPSNVVNAHGSFCDTHCIECTSCV